MSDPTIESSHLLADSVPALLLSEGQNVHSAFVVGVVRLMRRGVEYGEDVPVDYVELRLGGRFRQFGEGVYWKHRSCDNGGEGV